MKNQHCSELFQRKSALFSVDFVALKNWFFSADQSWISAVQRFSGIVQRWIRSQTALISSDNSWIKADQRSNPLRPQSGKAFSEINSSDSALYQKKSLKTTDSMLTSAEFFWNGTDHFTYTLKQLYLALILSETALNNPDFLWFLQFSLYWLELQFWILSAGKHRSCPFCKCLLIFWEKWDGLIGLVTRKKYLFPYGSKC